VHELGHFLAALWRGLKVERFSIGFGPRVFGWTRGGIDYRVSLFPLGGYVALPQLADLRAIEGETEGNAGQLPPISYWDKVIVAAAGPAFNVIFAFALALVVWVAGQPTSASAESTTIGYVADTIENAEGEEVTAPARAAGLQPGDKILEIDGEPVDNFQEITEQILTGGRSEEGARIARFTVERDGEVLEVPVRPVMVVDNPRSGETRRKVGISPAEPLVIGKLFGISPEAEAGLEPGDEIVAVNGEPVYQSFVLEEKIAASEGETIRYTVRRGEERQTIEVPLEPVRVSKPLAKITAVPEAENPVSLQLVPYYRGNVSPAEATASTPARLGVFNLDSPGGPFEDLAFGDRLVSVNAKIPGSLEAFVEMVNATEGELTMTFLENGDETTVSLAGARAEIVPPLSQPMPGFQLTDTMTLIHPGPVEQIWRKVEMTFTVLGSLINPESDIQPRNLMGPVGIVRAISIFSIDIRLVLWFVVLLNVNLAILNLLPIPVLDGGHIAFATLGALRGKPLPPSVIAAAQGTFMVLLFGFMLYIVFIDSLRWWGASEQETDFRRQIEQQQAYRIEHQYPSD